MSESLQEANARALAEIMGIYRRLPAWAKDDKPPRVRLNVKMGALGAAGGGGHGVAFNERTTRALAGELGHEEQVLARVTVIHELLHTSERAKIATSRSEGGVELLARKEARRQFGETVSPELASRDPYQPLIRKLKARYGNGAARVVRRHDFPRSRVGKVRTARLERIAGKPSGDVEVRAAAKEELAQRAKQRATRVDKMSTAALERAVRNPRSKLRGAAAAELSKRKRRVTEADVDYVLAAVANPPESA